MRLVGRVDDQANLCTRVEEDRHRTVAETDLWQV